MKREISVQVPGKINFHLEVSGKRKDGFHGITSLFQSVSMYDQLKLCSLTDDRRIELRGKFSCLPEQNTILQAARLILEYTGEKLGVVIEVEKRIPEGSGLGGGSADGAGTLIGMNTLLGSPLNNEELVYLGGQVGSDVPFFLSAAAAIVGGRGEKVFPIEPRTGFPALLVIPDFSISTSEAYDWIDYEGVQVHRMRTREELIGMYSSMHPADWNFCNTFEKVLFTRYPVLKETVENLCSAGALFSRVTGSGSTVFALFESLKERETAKKQVSKPLFSIWEVEMLDRSSIVVLQ